MIFFGCLARNFFNPFMDEYYPQKWTGYLRSYSFSIVLIRSGLRFSVRNKLKHIILLGLIPWLVEVCIESPIIYNLLDGMTYNLSFALSSGISGVGIALTVQCCVNLTKDGYGVEKGVDKVIIGHSAISVIITNIAF